MLFSEFFTIFVAVYGVIPTQPAGARQTKHWFAKHTFRLCETEYDHKAFLQTDEHRLAIFLAVSLQVLGLFDRNIENIKNRRQI